MALVGLNLFWCDPHEQPMYEWDKWLELITVAMLAIQSTSLTESNRTDRTEGMPALMGGPAEETASKNVISIFLLSIRQAARKTLLDKIPTIRFAKVTLPKLLDCCGQAFVVKRK